MHTCTHVIHASRANVFFPHIVQAFTCKHVHTDRRTRTYTKTPLTKWRHTLIHPRAGVVTWFDADRMTGHVKKAIIQGIDSSDAVVVFLTRTYLDKVVLFAVLACLPFLDVHSQLFIHLLHAAKRSASGQPFNDVPMVHYAA